MDHKQQKDIIELLGIENFSVEEKVAYLSKIADAVMDKVLLRLVAELSDDQVEAMEQFMETEPDPETVMKHLAEHHENFALFLKEEVNNLQEVLEKFNDL